MEDVMNGLLVSSDPYITAMSKTSYTSCKEFNFDRTVAGLLINFENNINKSDSSDSSDSD